MRKNDRHAPGRLLYFVAGDLKGSTDYFRADTAEVPLFVRAFYALVSRTMGELALWRKFMSDGFIFAFESEPPMAGRLLAIAKQALALTRTYESNVGRAPASGLFSFAAEPKRLPPVLGIGITRGLAWGFPDPNGSREFVSASANTAMKLADEAKDARFGAHVLVHTSIAIVPLSRLVDGDLGVVAFSGIGLDGVHAYAVVDRQQGSHAGPSGRRAGRETLTGGEPEIDVFTPRGEGKSLPLGATPIDFAYAIHTDIGNSCVGARVNGNAVRLDYTLRAGDVVQIVTRPDARPSASWLAFAKTAHAREEMRAWFKSSERLDTQGRADASAIRSLPNDKPASGPVPMRARLALPAPMGKPGTARARRAIPRHRARPERDRSGRA